MRVRYHIIYSEVFIKFREFYRCVFFLPMMIDSRRTRSTLGQINGFLALYSLFRPTMA